MEIYSLLFPCLLAASPPAPPPPEKYNVQISYRIDAFRNERLLQFYEMMRFLKKIGFQRDPNETVPDSEAEDVKRTRVNGAIPASHARDPLNERHIRSIQLFPHGAKPPEDKAKRVRVEIELSGGLGEPAALAAGWTAPTRQLTLPVRQRRPESQYQLSRQTLEVLAGLQFFEAVGYDHRGYTRLVGSMPSAGLDTLLTDLRQQPAGKKLPPPFRNVWAVRVSNVFPDRPLPAPRPRLPKVPKEQEKLSPDLRDALSDATAAAKPARLEVILAHTPGAEDKSYLRLLRGTIPGLIVEGRLGSFVSVVANLNQAAVLAALPEVMAVRLPRRVTSGEWQVASEKLSFLATRHSPLATPLAIVDSDFHGWEALAGKELPAATRLIDLTSERNTDLRPDPFAAGDGRGQGTRHALAIARLMPQIDLTLIRIDPAAPYLLQAAARAINGDSVPSINLDNRLAELQRDKYELEKRREKLTEERRLAFADLRQEGEAAKRRQTYFENQKSFDRDSARFHAILHRYLQYKQDLLSLRGIRVVASALCWYDGYPVDGTSALSRYFDDRPFRGALWFQAAGEARGQGWAGLFRDADGNGVMEFADAGQPLPADLWSPELNFLSWQTPDGQTARDLPAGARLRFSLQWREAHDPLYAQTGEDPYRQPLARGMRIFLLRQLDPTGTRQAADDLEIVAQSVDVGQRLSVAANSATYEITLDARIKQAGRYVVRIGGHAPDSIYPPGDPTLPFMRKHSELHVRLFVSPLDASGRAIFHDYATAAGSIGMPADAHISQNPER